MLKMTPDRKGIAFRCANAGNRRRHNLDRFESLNDGKVLLFGDISGCYLPSGSFSLASPFSTTFSFTLCTKEEDLVFVTNPSGNMIRYSTLFMTISIGIKWLQGVQAMTQFLLIPKPSARNHSYNLDSPTNKNAVDGDSRSSSFSSFKANSGIAFTISNDVQLILEGIVHFFAFIFCESHPFTNCRQF